MSSHKMSSNMRSCDEFSSFYRDRARYKRKLIRLKTSLLSLTIAFCCYSWKSWAQFLVLFTFFFSTLSPQSKYTTTHTHIHQYLSLCTRVLLLLLQKLDVVVGDQTKHKDMYLTLVSYFTPSKKVVLTLSYKVLG